MLVLLRDLCYGFDPLLYTAAAVVPIVVLLVVAAAVLAVYFLVWKPRKEQKGGKLVKTFLFPIFSFRAFFPPLFFFMFRITFQLLKKM